MDMVMNQRQTAVKSDGMPITMKSCMKSQTATAARCMLAAVVDSTKLTARSRSLVGCVLVMFASLASAIEPSTWRGYETESMTVIASSPTPTIPEVVTLRPLLLKPSTPPPWTSIVLPSSSAGLEDQMWPIQARAMVNAGIAVILVDSFNPRGFREVATDQFRVSYGKQLQDVHQVLDALRKDSRFVAVKIAIGGHSRGGVMALLSAYVDSADLLGRTGGGFNAFIATSAACEMTFKSTRLHGPLLLVNGTKDDYTWPEPCIDEVKRLAAAGEPAQIRLIEGAYHAMSTYGVIFSPRVMRTPKGVPRGYYKALGYGYDSMAGTVEIADTGDVTTIRALTKEYGGFLGRNLFGAHVGGAQDKAAEAVAATVTHLKTHGW